MITEWRMFIEFVAVVILTGALVALALAGVQRVTERSDQNDTNREILWFVISPLLYFLRQFLRRR